ncbi:hypothetical protein L195_g064129, partial [Trifolium pratense]
MAASWGNDLSILFIKKFMTNCLKLSGNDCKMRSIASSLSI